MIYRCWTENKLFQSHFLKHIYNMLLSLEYFRPEYCGVPSTPQYFYSLLE